MALITQTKFKWAHSVIFNLWSICAKS